MALETNLVLISGQYRLIVGMAWEARSGLNRDPSLALRMTKGALRMTNVGMASLLGQIEMRSFAGAQDDKVGAQDDRGARLNGLGSLLGVDWKWLRMDGAMTKAHLGMINFLRCEGACKSTYKNNLCL
jgi:hypothetical protein